MKVLVLGAGGQVGRAVVRAVPAGHGVVGLTRADLDIADPRSVTAALARAGADWIVNAAAYTGVDLAEDERARALEVNDTAVGVLAEAAAGAGCRLLHLSTDFVFDGASGRAYRPADPTHPVSVYGETKLGGEHKVLQRGTGVVLRTAWVYASDGRNFVLTMLKLMRERPELRVVCDQIGAPTWAGGLAGAIWSLLEAAPPPGVLHWTDLGVASWYDFAVAIQEEALARGLLPRAIPIHPIRSAQYPTRARRPPFSVLDTDSTRALTAFPARHWRHHLRMMLDELRAP